MDKQEPVAQDHIRGATKKVDMLTKAVSGTSSEARPAANSIWVGLTDEEIMEGLSSFNEYGNLDGFSFAQWVENKLKEKNRG